MHYGLCSHKYGGILRSVSPVSSISHRSFTVVVVQEVQCLESDCDSLPVASLAGVKKPLDPKRRKSQDSQGIHKKRCKIPKVSKHGRAGLARYRSTAQAEFGPTHRTEPRQVINSKRIKNLFSYCPCSWQWVKPRQWHINPDGTWLESFTEVPKNSGNVPSREVLLTTIQKKCMPATAGCGWLVKCRGATERMGFWAVGP